MKRKLIFLSLGVAVVLGIVFVLRSFILNRTPKQGVLKVSSNASVRVLVENREIGRTPLEEKIDTGSYSIRLVPDAAGSTLSSWQGNVTIGPNVLTFVNRDLSESELTSSGEILLLEKITSNKAELSVISIPDGANVVLNDQSKGVTPISLTDLSDGDHTLVVSSPGFEPRTVRVKLTHGYKLTASISLALSPPGSQQFFEDETPEASASALSPTPTPTPAKATPTPTKTPAPTKTVEKPKKIQILDTPTGFLRVRKTPSTSAEEIGRVKPGETYAVIDISGSWYNIAYTESTDGWISSQYAQKVE